MVTYESVEGIGHSKAQDSDERWERKVKHAEKMLEIHTWLQKLRRQRGGKTCLGRKGRGGGGDIWRILCGPVGYKIQSCPQKFGVGFSKYGCELLDEHGSLKPLLNFSEIKEWLSPSQGLPGCQESTSV